MEAKYKDKNFSLEKITEVYCFVSSCEDGEGIIGQTIKLPDIYYPTFVPFVWADKARMESLKPLAKNIARESGKKVKLIKLTQREEIEDIE